MFVNGIYLVLGAATGLFLLWATINLALGGFIAVMTAAEKHSWISTAFLVVLVLGLLVGMAVGY